MLPDRDQLGGGGCRQIEIKYVQNIKVSNATLYRPCTRRETSHWKP